MIELDRSDLSRLSSQSEFGSEYDSRRIEEEEGFPRQKTRVRCCGRQRAWELRAKCHTVLNVCFSLSKAPLREDGVVRYVNKAFKPQKIFQSELSEEVEKAWNEIMGCEPSPFPNLLAVYSSTEA